jgi:cytochrome bd-type quinol oxidase subunit 2
MDSNKAKEKRPGASTVATIILCILVLLYLAFSVLRSVGHIDFRAHHVQHHIHKHTDAGFSLHAAGALVSAAIHVFIPDGWLVKAFPLKNRPRLLTAMFAGLLLPVCECA